ncbi:MAG: sigma-54-dependent Fis family transcriptional regulator [Gammaproteobacteria bacterium]|nr:sigma-54-dependent Fis family transcriptional regulator [Gammaproteobacteria bacterium]
MRTPTILVVDDELKMQRIIEIMLADLGYQVLRASSGQQALTVIESEVVDLIITDLRMPEMDGITLLKTLHVQQRSIPTIVITAHGTVETAVEAMKYGAVDYLLRPFEVNTVELAVTRALGVGVVQRENRFLRLEREHGWQEFIGSSPPMRKLYQLVGQVGPSGAACFIVGETGTGKELVARAIHRASGRAGLFVPVNCAAIPAAILESEMFGHAKGAFTGAHTERIGKFEVADGGTLFLDEITEMPAELQAKLLRVLQDGRIERVGSNRAVALDLRVLAATNRDPQLAVDDGALRKDLYYRLNVMKIEVPPLRLRREDIPLLARHFLETLARVRGRRVPTIADDAMARLCAYDWPGNVREVENVMERALVLCNGLEIEPGVLQEISVSMPMPTPTPARTPLPAAGAGLELQPRIEALERDLLAQALVAAADSKSKAARLLDISERSLWYKLKKYGLN